MTFPFPDRIQTVAELTGSIRGLLETSFPFVAVVGEISNLRRPASGHLYFTLKDREAQIKAVLFKPQQRYLACAPEDGLEVLCRGRVSVYEPRGEYQIIIDSLDLKGAGALQIAFEQLKNRLAAEGLFSGDRKKPLPFLPARIALVTSPKGAAIADFLRMAHARFPTIPIEVYPVRVQGDGAADDIAEALRVLNDRQSSDVIVLCRGGGSIEDLWAFNEEKVARAIHGSRIPVVSAVGHEIDHTIADFAADFRAPTPTAAAEAVMPDKAALQKRLRDTRQRLTSATIRLLGDFRNRLAANQRLLGDPSLLLAHFMLRLDHARSALGYAMPTRLNAKAARISRLENRLFHQNPRHRLQRERQRTHELARQLNLFIRRRMERKRNELGKTASLLDAVSPLAVLARGYAVVRSLPTGTVIRAADQVNKGDRLNIIVQQGELDCEVTRVHPPPPSPSPSAE